MAFTTPTAKYGALITTVDPSSNLIDGVLKTGKVISIEIHNTPAFFRWPQVGESWMVRQENGLWYLDGAWPDVNAPNSIYGQEPGDAVITTPNGRILVLGSPDGSRDFDIVAPLPWTEVAFQNSWANLGTPYENASYMMDALGVVRVRGTITSGANGTVAFTLPAGFRPAATHYQQLATVGKASVLIASDGTATVNWVDNGTVGMSGITFLAEN